MTDVLSPVPVLSFRDNNGSPAAGYKLFTYSAGTTTKLATYTDSTGGTPNANPILLNYRGEANVWVPPNVAYKYVLASPTDTDPPANPIWTVDNIVSSQLITLYGGVDTGIANAYVLNFTANFASYTDGIVIYWIPSHTNTGASTINVNGLGVVNILNPDGTPLYLGELVANQFSAIIFSGGSFKLFAFGFLPKITTQNTNYTFALSDAQSIVQSNSIGPFTWTIPTNAAVAFPVGTTIDLVNNASTVITLSAAGGVTLTGYGVATAGASANQTFLFGACKIVKIAADAWQVITEPWQVITGAFTGTLTAMTVATTGSFQYSVTPSGWVTIWRQAFDGALTGTSNANTMTLTGIPAFISPLTVKRSPTLVLCNGLVDNGVNVAGTASITNTGIATFQILANPPVVFTAAGTKGVQAGFNLSYQS